MAVFAQIDLAYVMFFFSLFPCKPEEKAGCKSSIMIKMAVYGALGGEGCVDIFVPLEAELPRILPGL